MNIKEFESYVSETLQEFISHWIKQNGVNSNDWPLEMDSLADWLEQFEMYTPKDGEL